jgi:hypothetical protein
MNLQSTMAPEETKHSDASPPLIMTKLDSILFDSDKGPASSLFSEGGLSSSLPSSSDPMIRARGQENAVASSPRAVKFDAKVPITEEPGNKSKITPVEKLREQFHKVQAELATERSNRKRKEKSLIKLAKELNNRSADGDLKDKKMLELMETMEDLEIRLAERNRDMVVELPKLKAKCARQEAELAEHEKSTLRLRRQLEDARSEADKAKADLIAVLSKKVSHKDVGTRGGGGVVPTKTRGVRNVTTVLGFFALCAIAILVAVQKEVVSMDDVCAPVQPGSKFLATDKAVYEAPWWAPGAVKEQTFSILCGDRLRARFQVENGNVEVSSAGKNLWQGRALGGVTVDSKKITIRNKWGFVEEVPAPWSA